MLALRRCLTGGGGMPTRCTSCVVHGPALSASLLVVLHVCLMTAMSTNAYDCQVHLALVDLAVILTDIT